MYIKDEWNRWQQGGCLEYAIALTRVNPLLLFGSLYKVDGNYALATHHFAHDDSFAYDSAGRHPLPYRGIYNQADEVGLNEDPKWYDEADEIEIIAAIDHIFRNRIFHLAQKTRPIMRRESLTS